MSGGLLSGLSVVELVSFVAGPLCGTTLAGMGAEVVRVDPLGGAADRDRWPIDGHGRSIYWASLNRGKRSATLDLRSERGQDLVVELVAQSGVFVTNSARGWHSYAALAARRPDLIMVQITGRNDGGAAVDYTVNAKTGIPYLTGPAGSAPVNHSFPAWDVACGLYAALAVVSAVRRREVTGQGAHIVIPLEDVALGVLGSLGYLAEVQLNGRGRERVGNDVYGTFGHDFVTNDGRIMVVALSNRHWTDLLEVTGSQRVIDALASHLDADFSSEADRFRHRDLLISVLNPWFQARSSNEVVAELSQTAVLVERYRTMEEMIAEGTLENHPLFAALTQSNLGTYLANGIPIDLDGTYPTAGPAPKLGGDTADVLRSVGLAEIEINDLTDAWGLNAAPRKE